MNTISSLSELSIRRFADERNYSDGKKNFRNNLDWFKLADIFVKRGYRANAKRLMHERTNNKDNTQVNDVLIQLWLNNYP